MELVERLVFAAFVVFAVAFFGYFGIVAIVRAIRGTDLAFFEAMRTTRPQTFQRVVGACRWNGALAVGIGALIGAVGALTLVVALCRGPVEFETLLTGLLLSGSGAGLTWLALRWCRWGWRTKLD